MLDNIQKIAEIIFEVTSTLALLKQLKKNKKGDNKWQSKGRNALLWCV